jgi:signal recognition particle subunit SEC65
LSRSVLYPFLEHSSYRVTRELPEPLQAEVPSIEDLQEVVEKLRKELNETRHAQEINVEEP